VSAERILQPWPLCRRPLGHLGLLLVLLRSVVPALDMTVANSPKPTRPASFRRRSAQSGPPLRSLSPNGI